MDNAFIKLVVKAVLSSKNMYGGGDWIKFVFLTLFNQKSRAHAHTIKQGIHDLSIFGGYEYRAASSVRWGYTVLCKSLEPSYIASKIRK